MFIMSLYHYNMSEDLENFIEIANIIFTVIYTVEFLMKIIGLGPKYYFANGWNRFDFFILVLSWITIEDSSILFFKATVLRALRIVRVLRVVKVLSGIKRLFKSLKIALPSLINVGALLLLLYFEYSIAGMSLFGKLRRDDFITKHTNFETFYNSFITLFRASTGESWNGIMHDSYDKKDCHGSVDECGYPAYAIIF